MNSSSNISRKKITALRESKQQADFDGLDDFDKDALQGWEKASAGMELMRKNDRRFLPKSRLPFVFAGIAALALVFFLFIPAKHEPKPKMAQAAQVTVDKSDVVISEEIQKLEALPTDLQIKPEQVVSNFKSKQQDKEQASADNPQKTDEDAFVLPLKKIQLYSNHPKVSVEKNAAKEIYLSEMKLVDYRAYRSRPAIASEQMTTSGTPANQEKQEIQHDDPAWKAIDIPYHDYIRQTMEQFKSGNFKQALNRTNFILDSYPNDINALFYGGLCYYNLNDMDQAINAFQQVIANPFSNFDEEALWYLANAYDLKNDKAKAKELFQLIVSQKGYYAKQAERKL